MFRTLRRFQFWLLLAGTAMLYALGAGIAHYLSGVYNWPSYLAGQLWVTVLQISAYMLYVYYTPPANPRNASNDDDNDDAWPWLRSLSRQSLLLVTFTGLAVLASLTVMLVTETRDPASTSLFIGLGFLGAFFYSAPPISLATKGYGEFALTVLVVLFVPALALILQSGEMHRLLAMSAFPLAGLFLAMLLAFNLRTYYTDLKQERHTLMTRLGWQNGMLLHNLLILFAYLLLSYGIVSGLPAAIAFPAFLALPFGVFQIWQMRKITGGAKPNWLALHVTAMTTFALALYTLTYGFWMH